MARALARTAGQAGVDGGPARPAVGALEDAAMCRRRAWPGFEGSIARAMDVGTRQAGAGGGPCAAPPVGALEDAAATSRRRAWRGSRDRWPGPVMFPAPGSVRRPDALSGARRRRERRRDGEKKPGSRVHHFASTAVGSFVTSSMTEAKAVKAAPGVELDRTSRAPVMEPETPMSRTTRLICVIPFGGTE